MGIAYFWKVDAQAVTHFCPSDMGCVLFCAGQRRFFAIVAHLSEGRIVTLGHGILSGVRIDYRLTEQLALGMYPCVDASDVPCGRLLRCGQVG